MAFLQVNFEMKEKMIIGICVPADCSLTDVTKIAKEGKFLFLSLSKN